MPARGELAAQVKTPRQARETVAYDLSVSDQKPPIPRDVLAFNYERVVNGLADYADAADRENAERIDALRAHIGLGTCLLAEVRAAQRAKRKTVRIDDVLAAAQARLDSINTKGTPE